MQQQTQKLGFEVHMSEAIYQKINDSIDAAADEIIEASHQIHANPELAFKEFFACETLTGVLKQHDLDVDTGVFTLETAFQSDLKGSQEGPTAAILAEYDALPGIGHACGHNIIATTALGATLGLKNVIDQLPGTVRLLGTPAEEKGGGNFCVNQVLRWCRQRRRPSNYQGK